MRKTMLALLAVVMASTMGCHAQAPVTQHSVDLAWTAPIPVTGGVWQVACGTGANQSPCTYLISRATMTTAGPCPAVSTSGTPNYVVLNTASPATGLVYTDSSATGIVCYVAQAVQNATTGGPSNMVQLTVPANPGAPVMSNPTVALLDGKPALPPPPMADPQTASEQKVVLTATVR